MTTRRLTYAVSSLLVTGAVFFHLFSHVSPGAVIELVASADRGGVAMFAILSLAMSALRTWRYRLFLGASGVRAPALPLFLIVLVRNLFVDLLPARIGSLAYVYLVRERLGVPLAPATSSFALALVFDVLAQAPLLLLAVLFVGEEIAVSIPLLVTAGLVVGGLSGAGLLLLPRLIGAVEHAASRFHGRFGAPLAAFVGRVRRDVETTASAGVYGRALVLSLLIRVTKYAALYVFLFALLAPRGYGLADLGVAKVLLGTMAAEAAASLPISGIAGFGAYEGTWAVVFQLLGDPADLAKLTSVAHHLFTQAWGYGLGGLALLALLLPVFGPRKGSDAARAPARPPTWPLFAAEVFGLVALLVASLALARELSAAPRAEDAAAAPPPAPPPAERAALARLAERFPERILFDSNRGGTFGIHTIAADGTGVRAIVDGPAHETYPDPSPDGRWIVFARTASTWRLAPSDVWIARADGSGARELARDGTFPTFSADGETVHFERGRREVWSVPRGGGEPRRLFDPARFGFDGRELVKPRVSPDGAFVYLTVDRPRRWHAWGFDLRRGTAFEVGPGCEPTPTTDPRYVVWIRERDARGGSGVFLLDREKGSAVPLADADAPIGTEYFPTVTSDRRFLLYAAAPERERSHVDGEFSLFVKDLGNAEVFRLTFDRHVNRWPKRLPSSREPGPDPDSATPLSADRPAETRSGGR